MMQDRPFSDFVVVQVVIVVLTSLLAVVLTGFHLPQSLHGRRRWYAVVVLVAALGGVGAYAAVMDLADAELEVNDHSAPPGQSVQASGRGYQPREEIHLSLNLTQGGRPRAITLVETTTTDSHGRFELTFGVPMTAVGAEQLTASGDASGHAETTDFSVPALNPSIELSPATGLAGIEVEITGEEFFPGETVSLRAGRRPAITLAADERGTFSSGLRLPGSKKTEPGIEIAVTARGRVTGGPFGTATGTYVVTTPTRTDSVTPSTTEPESDTGNETGAARPTTGQTEQTGRQPDPPQDPKMPTSYRGSWTGEDTSDASLTTSMQLTLTGGEVGTIVGRSDYAAALTYSGTLRLMEVGSNYIIVRETLDSPSTGVTDILLGARSRNTLDYQTARRAVILSRG